MKKYLLKQLNEKGYIPFYTDNNQLYSLTEHLEKVYEFKIPNIINGNSNLFKKFGKDKIIKVIKIKDKRGGTSDTYANLSFYYGRLLNKKEERKIKIEKLNNLI
jgi:ABC-type amino acid transport substrate-binding protein